MADFIDGQPAERQQVTLTAFYEAILANDPTVTPVIKPMMGKGMIMYEERYYMNMGKLAIKPSGRLNVPFAVSDTFQFDTLKNQLQLCPCQGNLPDIFYHYRSLEGARFKPFVIDTETITFPQKKFYLGLSFQRR